jgi:ribosome recycling factor
MDPEFEQQTKQKMEAAVEHLVNALSRVRAGRASIAMLDHIKVNYHGAPSPLQHVATLATPESRLITIQPWDPSLIKEIERSITTSDLNLNPTNDGKIIRLPIPPLSEDRRKDLVKLLKKYGEEAKVQLRSVRHETNEQLRQQHNLTHQHKEASLSDDEWKKAEADVQKLTDSYIAKVQDLMKKKEEEVLEI